MTSYLLDTNAISETRKPRPDPGLAAWWSSVDQTDCFLSALTLGELRRGITIARHRAMTVLANRLNVWVGSVQELFSGRVLAFDTTTATAWGELSQPRTLPVLDSLIAATALHHNLTIVTRKVTDFQPTRSRNPETRSARIARPNPTKVRDFDEVMTKLDQIIGGTAG